MVIRICTSLSYTKNYNSRCYRNVLPCAFVNASRVFYALTDMESGSERKAKGEGITKQECESSRKNNATRRWRMHMVTYPCLTSRRFQLALIHRRVVDKRTSMHSRTASESTGARIHRPGAQRHQVRPAWRCQYDKPPCTVPFPGTAHG